MKKLSFISLVLFTFQYLFSQTLPCDQKVNYRIKATLNPDEKTVIGHQNLKWKNDSNQPISVFYFHAYMNAFKNSTSLFLAEADKSRNRKFQQIDKDDWGWLDINSVIGSSKDIFEDVDVLPTLKYRSPHAGEKYDETVFAITTPKPIPPGQSIVFEIEFTTKLPSGFPRTGYREDYFFVAQWFPKLGVYQEGEWICHSFHRNAEFFADFGFYDVTITVPQKYKVAASGVMIDSTQESNNTCTYRFQQHCIHDFAWSAFPDYKIQTRKFEFSDLPPVTMKLYYMPDHDKFVDDFFNATFNTLKYYGLWYIPYPYPQITIVDAAWKSRSAGMEYPTLFTTAADWHEPSGTHSSIGLTIHECGHQFWYGLIANNEAEHPWMDEGFNSYSDKRVMNAAYGYKTFYKEYLSRTGFGIYIPFSKVKIDPRFKRLEAYRKHAGKDPMNKAGWEYLDYGSYRANAYNKPSLMLWTLEGYLGTQVFNQIIKEYAKRFAFKHPEPDDFVAVVNEIAPESMDWYFDQMLNTAGTLDYQIQEIKSHPVDPKVGFWDQHSGKQYEIKNQTDQYITEITLRRMGDLEIPVDILLEFEDGETITEKWDGRTLWKKLTYKRAAPILKASIDPERKIYLDLNYLNNIKFREKNIFIRYKWIAQWMYWLQHFLETAAFFS